MGAQKDYNTRSGVFPLGRFKGPLRPPGFAEQIALTKGDPPPNSEQELPLLTSAQVAYWLGVSQRTVCLWAELDEIPAFKLGHQWRFREDDIRNWIQKHRAATH